MIFQQHYVVQALLAVTLVLTAISVATPDWVKSDLDVTGVVHAHEHAGLWKICGSLSTGGDNGKAECSNMDSDTAKKLNIKEDTLAAAKAMGILSCAFAFIALICSLFCIKKYVTVIFAALTVAASVAALVIYATQIRKDMDNSGVSPSSFKYGFSFWLQLIAAVLAAIAVVVPLRPGYIHSVTPITQIGKA